MYTQEMQLRQLKEENEEINIYIAFSLHQALYRVLHTYFIQFGLRSLLRA